MLTSTTQPRNAGPEPPSQSSVSQSFGLRVRVALNSPQQCLFGGDGPSVLTRMAEALCIDVPRIVVRDFRSHSQLERTIPAVLRNVRLSFWSCAARSLPSGDVEQRSMRQRRWRLEPNGAFSSRTWRSRRRTWLCASRGSAKTRNTRCGTRSTWPRATIRLGGWSFQRCIASVGSRRRGVGPKQRSHSNER